MDNEDMPQEKTDKVFSVLGRVITYGWQVVENLITLVVLLIVLSSGYTKFESLALSILSLIYLIIIGGFAGLGYVKAGMAIQEINRFNYIRKLLNEKLSSFN